MTGEIAQGYRRFATHEAQGSSPLYETLALHVAESAVALNFLAALSPDKRQPNLFFAAIRHLAGTPESTGHFDELVRGHGDEIAAVMRDRTTQTNEPGRCAVLLPALAALEGPLALLEVGASAGLCLLPDLYGYDYGRRRLPPPPEMRSIAPSLVCSATANTPLPERLPEIVWRAGLDLNPLDLDRDEDVTWLETLVWPEQTHRLARLKAAIAVARQHKPRIVRGDLRRDLPDLLREAPRDATLVIFHTAVLSYLPSQTDRDAFARRMKQSDAVWISNESPRVFLEASQHLPTIDGMFLMMRNGQPLAWTAPHGQAIHWLDHS